MNPLSAIKIMGKEKEVQKQDLGSTEKSQQQEPQTRIQPTTAGRDLDALIAEKVMGYQWWRSSSSGNRSLFAPDRKPPDWFKELADGTEPLVTDWKMVRLPAFSTSIADAWSVVEKVDNRNDVARQMGVRAFSLNRYDNGYGASFFNVDAFAETAPLAICLAALSAVLPSTQEEKK